MEINSMNDYEMGLVWFEKGEYEEALKCFIQAYEQGIAKQEILENIYACYVQPNEQEFRTNYLKNKEEICNVPYEELLIDFIPVSDTRYYMFNRESETFLGVFDLEDELIFPEEKELQSVLIADVGDIRQVMDLLTAKNWSTVYFILNEQKYIFASFLKLPDFTDIYLNKAVIFESTDMMRLFFESYSYYYLPRQVVAPNADLYIEIVNQIHAKRISQKETQRENIFLSICIPTYNRGSIVLKSVQNILKSGFDAEIEIVISNNGSEVGVEEYKQIEQMQDSRVSYFEFETNQGYATNVYNALKRAKGCFAMIASDEDEMLVDNLGAYMSYLLNNSDAGLLGCSGVGKNFLPPTVENYAIGYDAIVRALNWNYVTGMTINTDCMRRNRALELFEEMRGNLYLEYYAHCVLALFTTYNLPACKSDIVLWCAGQSAEPEEDEKILGYMWPQSRMEQLNTCVDILSRLPINKMDFFYLFYERMGKTYVLLRSLYLSRHKAFIHEFSWREVMIMLHENNWKLIELWKQRLAGGKLIQEQSEALFFEYLLNDSVYDMLDGEERWRQRMIAQLALYENKAGVRVIDIDMGELEGEAERMIEQWKKKANL